MERQKTIELSPLAHTWILDFDGTLVVHNGYKTGKDEWLPGAKEFLNSIPPSDYVLILTAREEAAKQKTLDFLRSEGIKFDDIKFEMPMGERILINDRKPSGLVCAISQSPKRNEGVVNYGFIINPKL